MIVLQITMKMKESCRFRSLKLMSVCFQEGEEPVAANCLRPGHGGAQSWRVP